MQRLMVIGPCGAGKSHCSHRLSAALQLPLFHLDQLHWKPGWVEGSKHELREALEPILAQERWVIDGNYASTMEPRLARADKVIYLDYPIPLCLWRAARRVWQYRGVSRPDMSPDCPERFDPAFFHYIAIWNRKARPRTERLLEESRANVLRFKSPRSLDIWLNQLELEQKGAPEQ